MLQSPQTELPTFLRLCYYGDVYVLQLAGVKDWSYSLVSEWHDARRDDARRVGLRGQPGGEHG